MRTMADMGMAGMAQQNMPGMKGMKKSGMAGMQHDSMPSMDPKASAHPHDNNMPSGEVHSTARMGNYDQVGTEPFPQPGPHTTRFMPMSGDVPSHPMMKPQPQALHIGPSVGMVAMNPTTRLGDPGDGLNGNGRRVLTYSDLRALYRGVDGRPPSREIELHLTGNMERYLWGFDGYRFSNAEPVHLKLGERVRIVLINDTMMEHPIHLHGLWGELENGQGEFLPYKHTIIVKPAERVSYLVSADTPGRWAYHCHLQYHMEAGMFRTVIVS
jgi:FtsP/CotA-like multicopper oxidase with cupredoxin domain